MEGKRRRGAPQGNLNGATPRLEILNKLLKQGLDADNPVGRLLVERRTLYVQDIGGREAISELEHGLCDRLARLDVWEAILQARMVDPITGKLRRISFSKLQSIAHTRARLCDSYTRMALALGLRRRSKEVPDLALAFKQAADAANGSPGT
jgi:hypothetical protein